MSIFKKRFMNWFRNLSYISKKKVIYVFICSGIFLIVVGCLEIMCYLDSIGFFDLPKQIAVPVFLMLLFCAIVLWCYGFEISK